MKSYKNIVYISHPYGNDEKNQLLVGELIKNLVEEYPDYLFVSPIHSFSFLYSCTTYQKGLDMCLWLLHQCDEVWVFGDYQNSVGCMAEIAYCKNHSIPYRIMSSDCYWQRYELPCNPETRYLLKYYSKYYKWVNCLECSLANFDDDYAMRCQRYHIAQVYEKCKIDNGEYK